MDRIVRKVWDRKDKEGKSKQLLITIPLDEGIAAGDYVEVKKV